MELKISIARESDYREDVIDHYNSIMNGRLLSLDLGKADDSDILSFISFYDENESYFNNCCSWLEIGEIGSSNYNGRDFQFINLLTKSGGSIQINFSQFIYEISTSLGQEGFTTFNSEKAFHVCSIDEQRIDPSTFFSINKGKRLVHPRIALASLYSSIEKAANSLSLWFPNHIRYERQLIISGMRCSGLLLCQYRVQR